MIEPAMTTLARRFYDHFHEEPVDVNAGPFGRIAINPDRDPFNNIQAIPTLPFASPPGQMRLEPTITTMRVRSWQSLFACPLSGGPDMLIGSMLALRTVLLPIRKHPAFGMIVVLERV